MKVGIALGSNLGDRLRHLREAVSMLLQAVPNAHLLAAAPVYETDPVDCPPGSQSFLNTVVELECSLEPVALLRHLRTIEATLGRPNVHAHHAPRTVDLDMLYAGDSVMDHPDLILPHPRLAQRRFVLQPLADIRPELVLPGQSRSIRALLDDLPSHEAAPRLAATSWISL